MRKFTINNVKFYVGKTDRDNTEIVNNFQGTDYTWFHLKDFPSAHLVIEKSIKELTDQEKQVCANMVKYYSKKRKEWTSKYYVDLVYIGNVSPQNTPGLVIINNGIKLKIKPQFNFNPSLYIYTDKKCS